MSFTVSSGIIVPVNGCFVHMTAVRNEAWQPIKPGGLLMWVYVKVCVRVCVYLSLIFVTNNSPHLCNKVKPSALNCKKKKLFAPSACVSAGQ